jgi:hypothetical protein
MPELTRSIDMQGCIVTADALNTRKETARRIAEQGVDYGCGPSACSRSKARRIRRGPHHPLAEAEIRAFMEPLADSLTARASAPRTSRPWTKATAASKPAASGRAATPRGSPMRRSGSA